MEYQINDKFFSSTNFSLNDLQLLCHPSYKFLKLHVIVQTKVVFY